MVKTIIWVLGLDMTSYSVTGHMTTSVVRSFTAQPPGSCPEALQLTTHSQQMTSLWRQESYPNARVKLEYSTAPANRAVCYTFQSKHISFTLSEIMSLLVISRKKISHYFLSSQNGYFYICFSQTWNNVFIKMILRIWGNIKICDDISKAVDSMVLKE